MADADKINLAIAIISGLSALASFAVCLATFRILKATQDTLETTKAQMIAARRPYLDIGAVVDIEQPVLSLIIRNTGSSAAERVRLTMDQDFFFNGEAGERNIRDLPIFRGPVDSIPPRAEIRLMLGVGHAVFGRPDLSPPKFRVTAQYAFEGMEFSEASAIDLDAFKGHAVGKSPQGIALEKIAKATEAIAARLTR